MVTRDFTPAVIPTLTTRSREWAEIFRRRQQEATRRLYPVALGEILDDIVVILKEEIEEAVAASSEYNRYQWMKNELIKKVCVPEVVVLDARIGRIYLREGIENLGGGWDDFWDGVNNVRADLEEESESTRVLTVAQKAAFWRNKVWPSDHYYSRTMKARRNYWGDLTPWWLWLDAGNSSSYAHPQNEATYFVDEAEGRANELFDQTMDDLYEEIDNIMSDAIALYINDPEAYAPYDVLAEFYEQGRAYEIYVTETGRIGTRLQ